MIIIMVIPSGVHAPCAGEKPVEVGARRARSVIMIQAFRGYLRPSPRADNHLRSRSRNSTNVKGAGGGASPLRSR